MKKRAARYMLSTECPLCHGKRLRRESLSVKFAGMDIGEMSSLPLIRLAAVLRPHAEQAGGDGAKPAAEHGEKTVIRQRIAEDLMGRIGVLLDLGLGYLALERSTPTLSPGELQRLRLATQVHSNLFGVVYVLDEPSAGLHPADTEALLRALDRLKASGNSLFVVEHDLDVIRHADWLVDVGPAAGEEGGRVLLQRAACGARRCRSVADATLPVPRRQPVRAHAAQAPGMAEARRCRTQQSRGNRCSIPPRRVHDGHRGIRFGQVESRQSGAGRTGRRGAGSRTARRGRGGRTARARGAHCRRRPYRRRSARIAAPGARGPEAHRAHPAFQPRHLYRPVRSRPASLRRDEGGP